MRVSEILGVGAYTFAFALLESIGVLFIMLLLIIILPKKLVGDMVIVKNAVVLWAIAIWTVSYHYLYIIIPTWKYIYRNVCQIIGVNINDGLIIQLEYFLFVILWVVVCREMRY
jgi:hypothetical protein